MASINCYRKARILNQYSYDGEHNYRFIRKHNGRQLDIRLTMDDEEYSDRSRRCLALVKVRKEINDHRGIQ